MTAKPDLNLLGLRGDRRPTALERRRGVVKWFSATRGYGFIVELDRQPSPEFFFHHSQIDKGVRPVDSDAVTFLAVDGPKGPAAHQVHVETGS